MCSSDLEVGFNGQGKARIGEDSVETKDIVVGGEVLPEVMCKGGGDDKGCDGELSRSGVSKSGGKFDGHGWRIGRGIARESL